MLGRPDGEPGPWSRAPATAGGADLGLEVVADVLAAVVVAQPQAGSDALGEAAMASADGLPDRLQGLEPAGAAGGVDADALGRAVVDGHEHRGLTLAGHHRGQVGPPHHVDPLGRDRAVVRLWPAGPPGALRCQQAVRPHEPQDAASAGADVGEAQPGPELAVTLAVEGAVPQELPDRLDQGLVRHRADRLGPPTLAPIRAAVAVDGRPRDAPEARDPLQTVDSVGGGRDLPAHR